jgi:tellurite resistance protein
MEQADLEQLREEFRRYNTEDFLDATVAVCALSAIADDEVAPDELYSMDHLVFRDPVLQKISAFSFRVKLQEYLDELAKDRTQAERVLSEKVGRMAGDHERATALMRAAYLIIVSDHAIRNRELDEFKWLCGLLGLDPAEVWDELAHRFLLWDDVRGATLVRAPASAVARIVNASLEGKWRVFENFDEAKTAAAEVYRRAIEYYTKVESPELQLEMERRLAELPHLTASEVPRIYD